MRLVPVYILDAQADFMLLRVHVYDHRLNFIPRLGYFAGLFDPLIAELGDMHQPFDSRFDLHEGPEFRDIRHLPLDHLPDFETVMDVIPRVLLDLFDPQGKPLVFLVDVQDNRLHLLSLFVNFRGVLQALNPGNVGDMDQTIDPFIDSDENAKFGEVLDPPLNFRSHRITLGNRVPGVGGGLL